MQSKTEIKRVPLPSNDLFHPVAGTNDIFTVVPNTRNQLQSDYINGAQVLWFTISANHLASSATSFTDFNDDTDSQMMKMLFFFLLQVANTFSIEVDEPVNADDQPRGENATMMTKKVQIPLARFLPRLQGEPAHPSRKIFVEQLFADSDPEQKIGYRFAFCLYSDECGWTNLAYEAASVNERRYRRRAPRFEELAANPNFEVISLDRLASLYCYYLGNPKGGYRKMSAALWNVATANDVDNDAYPSSVFSFENSCNNLARFSNNETTVQLSMVDDTEHVLDIQSQPGRYYTLESQGGRSRRLNLTFPIPDAVWEIDSPYWSYRALEGILLPGFETSEMEKLANSMRDKRISVNNASGRLDTDMAREILNMSMNTAEGVEGAEEVSMAVLHDTDELPATAVFGEHSRIDIASMSSSEQFRLTSSIVRLRDENAPVVQEFKRANYTKKQFDKKYKSYRKKAVKNFLRDVMTRNNKRLSGPERSVVNYFLTYVNKRQGQSFVPEEFTMPTTDPSLSPAANYIKALMDEKEANGMSTFHVPDLILWTGLNDSWRYGTGLHINFVLTGTHGAGKSYLQNRIKKRCIRGVCAEAMHETAKAAMTAGNRNGEINIMEELPPWMFGNSDGQGVETGDPTLKARLTQAIISVVYFHYDKETGDRVRKVIYAMAMTTTCAATNEEWYQMPAALRNRFWHITAPKHKRVGQTPANLITEGRPDVFGSNNEIEFERSQFEQSLIAITEWLIATRCICIMTNGVNMQLFYHMAHHHYQAMEKNGIDASDVRVRQRVLYFARTLTIRMAIYWLCFTPLSKYRLTKRFDLHQFAIDIEEQLVCTEEIVNFAFELSASQFVDPNVTPVARAFASLTKYDQFWSAPQQNVNRSGSQALEENTETALVTYESSKVDFAPVVHRVPTATTTGSSPACDYNYVYIGKDLNTVAENIANETKNTHTALAKADIRAILRSLADTQIRAAHRTDANPLDETTQSQTQAFPIVIIDPFAITVKMHCGFLDAVFKLGNRNLIEDIVREHRHPLQSGYDTVSITGFQNYPNLLPRICIRPTSDEEYAAGPKYLVGHNRTAKSREYCESRNLTHQNPTPFRQYMELFETPDLKYDRIAPETEVIDWHLAMTGHDPSDDGMLRAYPEGRQAYARTVTCAQELYRDDIKADHEAKENGTAYTRLYPTPIAAIEKAQEMVNQNEIAFEPTYPLVEIVKETEIKLDQLRFSRNPQMDRKRLQKAFESAIDRSGFPQERRKETREKFDSFRNRKVSTVSSRLPSSLKRIRGTDDGTTALSPPPKRQHLLVTQTFQDVVASSKQLQERRRRAQQQMLARRNPPPKVVQEMTSDQLIAAFRDRSGPSQPATEPDPRPEDDELDLQELMARPNGMQIL